jgi:hypothetical protein
MNKEHIPEPESVQKQIEQETAELNRIATEINVSLDEVEASSPGRLDKIEAFLNRHWFTVMGGAITTGGPMLLYKNLHHANWKTIAVELGLGLGGGHLLERAVKSLTKRGVLKEPE